ncbi:MAG: lipocalin family protein [Brevundimonas sp.]|nr:lipocalin family protein [Brevundimonas sp.]
MIRPLVAALVLSAAATSPAAAQSLRVDMDRFDGRWFEVARSPNDIQRDCSRSQIDFTAQGRANRYGILVTCTRRGDGETELLRANARVTDPGANTSLRFTLPGLLSFGGLAGQTYRVLDRAPDYGWAILALPDRSDWWIWHRSQSPSAAVREQLLARARAAGLDTGRVVHTGR